MTNPITIFLIAFHKWRVRVAIYKMQDILDEYSCGWKLVETLSPRFREQKAIVERHVSWLRVNDPEAPQGPLWKEGYE